MTSLPTAFARPPERVSHAYDVNTKGRTDESVHVFVSPPEQHPYEGEQQESGQLPKCFSKASEIVLPFQHPPMSATATDQMQFQASKSMPNYDVYEKEDSTCINIISGVRDFTIELQQQNDERACHCPVMKASDSLVTRSSQLSVDHSMSKLRMLWDPGDTNFLQSLCATTAVQMTDYNTTCNILFPMELIMYAILLFSSCKGLHIYLKKYTYNS